MKSWGTGGGASGIDEELGAGGRAGGMAGEEGGHLPLLVGHQGGGGGGGLLPLPVMHQGGGGEAPRW